MSAKEDESGFLARWSRRKAGAARGERAPEAIGTGRREIPQDTRATPRTGVCIERAAGAAVGSAPAASVPPAAPSTAAEPLRTASAEAPPLTLADVARLGRDSDYAPFVQAGVDPAVKNAALKKLFADPRFNVMDGLDTYIDDYGKPDPIPPAMLRRLNQARHLGLFDADPEEHEGTSTAQPSATPSATPAALASGDEEGSAGPPPESAGPPRSDRPLRSSVATPLESALDAPPSAATSGSARDDDPLVAPDPVR